MTDAVERRFTQDFPRYYDWYVPDGDGPFPLLVAMHGYGGDKASMMRLARRISDTRYAIAALQGPHQHVVYPEARGQALKFGFGWASNFRFEESLALHAEAVRRILDDAATDPRVDATRAFLVGFSQAVAFNLRVALADPDRIRGIVGICGGIPGDLATNEAYRPGDFDVLLIGGETDPYYDPDTIRANAGKLRPFVRSVDVRIDACGHEVPRDVHPAIDAWLAER